MKIDAAGEKEKADKFNVNWERDIHKFKFNGLRILLDVNSGSTHLIDKITWDVLNALEKHDGSIKKTFSELENLYLRDELREVISDFETLASQEMLFTNDDLVKEHALKIRETSINSVCLLVSTDCNMACKYCFAADGDFDNKALMPEKVGEKALDFLIENSGERKHIEADFFGGEPLLNFDVVKQLIKYGKRKAAEKGKRIRFTLTTNCLLLNDEISEFLSQNDIQVVMSLDGRKQTNDRMRLKKDGAGSYDEIVNNISRFLSTQKHNNYFVRGTYTKENLDFSKDVLHLFELGLQHISVEPVVAPPENYGLTADDLSYLEKEYERLTLRLLERIKTDLPADFFHYNIDISGGPCIPKRIRGCGAGFEYFAVSPDGEIFACHQFAGESGFKMGDVFSGITREDLVEQFRSAHIYNKPDCADCWARFYCSGGCQANAYHFNYSLLKPYVIECSLQKKRIECGIYFQIAKKFFNEKADKQLQY